MIRFKRALWLTGTILLALPSAAFADEASRRQALFGDVHVHTGLSFDSYIFGIRRTPDDAFHVLENSTCRWSTYEANRLGKPVRKDLPLTIQERAWSSPIWVRG